VAEESNFPTIDFLIFKLKIELRDNSILLNLLLSKISLSKSPEVNLTDFSVDFMNVKFSASTRLREVSLTTQL